MMIIMIKFDIGVTFSSISDEQSAGGARLQLHVGRKR